MALAFAQTKNKRNTNYHGTFQLFPAIRARRVPPPPPIKKTLWPCKLASKYKVARPARNASTKDGGSPLSFVPGPQAPKGQHPYVKIETSKL